MASFILLILLLVFAFAVTIFSVIGGGYFFGMIFGVPMWIGACITIAIYFMIIIVIIVWEHYIFKE